MLLKVLEIFVLCLSFGLFLLLLLLFLIAFSFIPRLPPVSGLPPQEFCFETYCRKLQMVKLLLNSEKTVTITFEIINSFSYYSSC